MKAWPSTRDAWSANARATTSVGPPAEKPTTMRTGLVGYVCARTGCAPRQSAPRAAERSPRRSAKERGFFTMVSGSIHTDAAGLHHTSPFGGFDVDKALEFGAAGSHGLHAERGEPLLQVSRRQRAARFVLEPRQHRRRRARGREEAVPLV